MTFISRNSGTGSDFFGVNLRVSRAFRVGSGARIDALVEMFNVTNRVNPLTRTTNFGPGAYPANPSPTFDQITAVGDPRTFQIGMRLSF